MENPYETMIQSLSRHIGISEVMLGSLIWSFLAVFIFLMLRLIFGTAINRRSNDLAQRYALRKATNYILGVFLFLALLRVLLLYDAKEMATYLGFVSAGLAIALQTPS